MRQVLLTQFKTNRILFELIIGRRKQSRPEDVLELGDESFADCTSLPLMDLPESVDAIGEEAFLNCTALTTVTIRNASFDSGMGNDVFRGCDSLSTLWMYPWHWGKLVSSIGKDENFLKIFSEGR